MENIIINGKLTHLYYGSTRFENKEMYRMTIEANNINREDFDKVYKDNKFAPKWYTNNNHNIINLKTKYDIPVKFDERVLSLDDFIEDGRTNNAKVQIKLKITDKGVYPKSINVIEMGTKYDPFEDFQDSELPFK